MNWTGIRRLRRVVQVGFLALFLWIGFVAFQNSDPGPLAEGLFPFDPLAAAGAMLASRSWIGDMAWAVGTVVLSILLGRFFCGWVCPLGTTLEYIRFRSAQTRQHRLSPRLRSVKYLMLVLVVILAAFGGLTFLVLDPIALFSRAMTVGPVSAVNAVVGSTGGPSTVPHFAQGIAISCVFTGVIALNLLADRFWCRYLCPLGALLGALAKFAVFRPVVGEGCNQCGACSTVCRLGAIDTVDTGKKDDLPSRRMGGPNCRKDCREVIASECTLCLDCLADCPIGSMRFGMLTHSGPWREYDPGRRELLTGAAAGVGAAALLATGPWGRDPPPAVLRPPGVLSEREFLSSCIRCGVCTNVCPTSALQPAFDQAGVAGLWTPVLRPRFGHCDYDCSACGAACPSGAIPRLRLATKRLQVIGVAVIDRDKCLPWSQDVACTVCQEVCPVPKKAIVLTEGNMITTAQGFMGGVEAPIVLTDFCIGCGLCENRCPVRGTRAITVQPSSSPPTAPLAVGHR